MKSALVTGANGFVGSHIVRALLDAGFSVRAFGRSAPVVSAPGVEFVQGDICDFNSHAALVTGVSAVVHCAAFIPPNHTDSTYAARCYEVNALATLRLGEAFLNHASGQFVYASGSNAYPPSSAPVLETQAPYPADRAAYYLTSKVAGEIYLEHLARTRGLSLSTFRISSPYGMGMPPGSVVARFMALASEGKPLTVRDGGATASDLVHVGDVAKAVLAALERQKTGIYNIGSGEHSSLLTLAQTVLATYPETGSTLDVEPPKGAPAASFAPIDITKARRELDYQPRTLAKGLLDFRAARQML
ncbi:MAG: NAD(P)-dependent oxidoreductase [Polyangiaceae bacterium]|nr:NAD(P)-dependent oxidoreductase [Polyangiaceae bacterium]